MTKWTSLLVTSVSVIALSMGCKKKEEGGGTPPPDPGSGTAMAGTGSGTDTMAGTGSGTDTMAGTGSGTGAGTGEGSGTGGATAIDPNADALMITADHVDKSKGTVDVTFTGIKVVKADFDPAKVEGGKATIEVDLSTLSSGIEKRDNHLKSPDYIDVGKFAKLTIDIDKVKKKADKTYTATATVKLRDKEKKYPVTFDVVEQTDDSIKIKGEHKFPRTDFGVGKKDGDSVAPDLTAKLQLTIKKT